MIADRRTVLASGTAMLALAACRDNATADASPPAGRPAFDVAVEIAALEQTSGGTLGACLLDTASGALLGHRLDERFGHCSSFKTSLAAMVLAGADNGTLDLSEQMAWEETAMLGNSPFTMDRLGTGATLAELARAVQVASDNTAANVLLGRLGGPEAVTAFWRELGDETSRLDRTEPQLNNAPAGDPRDTTTPRAMAQTLAKIATGDVLAPESRATLLGWMAETTTGTRRIRAGLPEVWQAANKTGTSLWPGIGSLYVDIAVLTPSGATPLVLTGYFRANETHEGVQPEGEAVLARLGRIAARWHEFHSAGR
ncbi:class A beta-lactamase [Paraurantiacibacter namhicola]|uniref:beta-lactamase n=1 Tax=Paraurantiacibacter namhicola TaxID=645517 RepID=A0A1C7DBC0_9SPHN|nr:class A beta-lactamase [Paraurantiacibacter namhicola]ANU08800.1 Beta-lactamase Toho-1 precursor [Paraurantiacibacter namhicola]